MWKIDKTQFYLGRRLKDNLHNLTLEIMDVCDEHNTVGVKVLETGFTYYYGLESILLLVDTRKLTFI